MCLDIDGGKSADKTNIQVYGCNQSNAQFYAVKGHFVNKTEGGKEISELVDVSFMQASSTGFCLDVAGSGTAAGTNVQLFTCNGTDAQNWYTD